jgi:transcriptional regulator with XRE-family HTH domain
MTQSDLARAAFGTDASADGDTVARSHDRISVYLAGQALPDPKNRKALAEALGLPVEELAAKVVTLLGEPGKSKAGGAALPLGASPA